jgi:hypothetical protein
LRAGAREIQAERSAALLRLLPDADRLKNAGQVALEIGNSAAIVMKHYFDIVGHE